MHLKEGIERSAREATHHTKPWIRGFSRFGYAAKGVVYMIVGWFAAQAAFGLGGSVKGKSGILKEIAAQPFGQTLLGIVTVGLLGYTLWRFVQAFYDTEGQGRGAKGMGFRFGFVLSGLVYAGLAFIAASLLFGWGGSSKSIPEQASAALMAQPYGRWLVGLGGVVVIGIGIYQFVRAYRAGFESNFSNSMRERTHIWLRRAGRVGFSTRGVVLIIVGVFLIRAALRYNPDQAAGLGEALRTVAQQPYGTPLLGITAVGLALYGLFALLMARYRHLYV